MPNENQRPGAYELLEEKEFKSSIPPHLLGKLSEGDRWMVEAMSRLENQNNWIVRSLIRNNRDILDCDRRIATNGNEINALQKWKTVVCTKWSVVITLTLIVMPILLKVVFDWLSKHIHL